MKRPISPFLALVWSGLFCSGMKYALVCQPLLKLYFQATHTPTQRHTHTHTHTHKQFAAGSEVHPVNSCNFPRRFGWEYACVCVRAFPPPGDIFIAFIKQ